jgi:hypothetical protein
MIFYENRLSLLGIMLEPAFNHYLFVLLNSPAQAI